MKSKNTTNGTSLLGLVDGDMQLDWLDCQTTHPSLPDHHHVSHSAAQVREKATQIIDTSPRIGSGWSRPSGLLSFLGSKLQPQSIKTIGLMIYSMGWKQKVTPQGRSYFQLAASARRTFDSDCGLRQGWPTPTTHNAKELGYPAEWNRKTLGLGTQAHLSGWPTPQTMDTLPPKTGEALARNKKKGGCSNLREHVHMAGWPTPKARDYHTEGKGQFSPSLPSVAEQISGWPTSQTMNTLPPMDYEKRLNHPSRQGRSVSGNLREVVTIAQATRLKPDGTILTGSSAEMESGGQLDPAHSRWLMGYPPEWDDCAVTAMPSSRRSRRK